MLNVKQFNNFDTFLEWFLNIVKIYQLLYLLNCNIDL